MNVRELLFGEWLNLLFRIKPNVRFLNMVMDFRFPLQVRNFFKPSKLLLSSQERISVLNIIHPTVLSLKHKVSKTGFWLRLQVEPTQMGPIDRANLCLRTPATTETRSVEPRQHMRIQISTYWTSTYVGPILYIHGTVSWIILLKT
jgi:hypothetical protein